MLGNFVCRKASVSSVWPSSARCRASRVHTPRCWRRGRAPAARVEGERALAPVLPDMQPASPGSGRCPQRRAAGPDVDALGGEALLQERRDLRILVVQNPWRGLDQRDLAAQPREGLRQLAADGAAAENHQSPGQFSQLPHGVRRHIAGLAEPRQRRHGRPRARGDDDVPGRQRLRAVAVPHLDRPRRRHRGGAQAHVHAQLA